MASMPTPYTCAICGIPASVWCHQDAASVCFSCDEREHTANSMARCQVRTALPDQAHPTKRVSSPSQPLATVHGPPTAAGFECYSSRPQGLTTGEHNQAIGESFQDPDKQGQDFFSGDDAMYVEPVAGDSFGYWEFGQESSQAEALVFADSDLAEHKGHGRLSPGDDEGAWGLPWPFTLPHAPSEDHNPKHSTSGHTYSAPSAAAHSPSPAAAAATTATAAAAAHEHAEEPDAVSGGQHSQLPVTFSNHSFASAATAAPGHGGTYSAAAIGQMIMTPWGPQPACAMPYMAHFAAPGMAFVQQAVPWTAYLPASLRPRPHGDEAIVTRRAATRDAQIARFRSKKQQQSVLKPTRYENRKRFARSRPRVNGRFVSKALSARAEHAERAASS
eukprot:jgi/Ulvmu1/3285/UM152_0007.1